MYDDNMLYGFTQSLNKLAIAVCFTRQAFLYKLEYDFIQFGELTLRPCTNGLIIVNLYGKSNCRWSQFKIRFTQAWRPLYFLIS